MTQYSATFAGRAHTLRLTLTEGSKDVKAKKVRINYKLEILKGVNRTTWNVTNANQPWSIELGGTTIASGTKMPFNFSGSTKGSVKTGTRFTVASGSYQDSYASNGSLSLSVVFSADADVWSGGSHNSGTKMMGVASYPSSGTEYFEPSSIAVATKPTVSPRSTNVGVVVTIKLPRTSPSFTHDVTWKSGSLSGSIGTGLGTSKTWTVPDVTAQFPTQSQSPVEITAVTKSGSTVIGSNSVTLLVWSTPPSIDPTITIPFDVRLRRVEWNGTRLKATSSITATSVKLTDTASSTPTLSISTSGVVPGTEDPLDGSLAILEVQNGASWQATGLLFVLSRSDGDNNDPAKAASYSGTGYLDYVLARGYQSKDWKKTGSDSDAGSVMKMVLDSGHSKDWGTNIHASFSTTNTSMGEGWRISGDIRELSGGTPYSQVLEALVNDGWSEWRGRYNDLDGKVYLDLYNPGTGSDWTDASAQVIVNLSTGKVSSAPSTWSFEKVLDRVYAIGDSSGSTKKDENTTGHIASSERDPYNLNLFGYLEGWTAASGQTTTSAIRNVAKGALENATQTVSRQFSYSAYAVSRNLLPYYTFKPGDWILIPSDKSKTADPVSMRVTQVVINKSIDGLTITVTCGDLIPSSASASTMRKLKASTGGRIAGGTLRDPIPLQSIVPEAPDFATEEAAVSVGYWTTIGEARSTITFEWLPVTEALDGVSQLDVDYYEIWWRPNPSVPWALKTFSTITSVEMDDWPVYFTAQFRVRARSSAGTLGSFSGWDEVVTVAPTSSIPALAVDQLYTDGVGTIFATWNGSLGSGSLIPSYFAYMTAEVSVDDGNGAPSATWKVMGNPLQSAGEVTLNPGAYGTYWIRFRAYDKLGGPGVNGIASEITTTDPHVDPAIPLPPTGLTSTAGASWDENGIKPDAWFNLTWTLPTLDVDGNPIEIVGYSIWGKEASETSMRYLTTSNSPEVRIEVTSGETWAFQVGAVSDFGGVSALSATISDTADAAIAPPVAPDAPVLSQYAGILQVEWGGGGMVQEISYAYAVISDSPSGPFTRAGMPLNGSGQVVIPGLPTGDTYYAKMVVVDQIGQETISVVSDGLLLNPITGVTVQTSPDLFRGIKLTDGGLAAYSATGDLTFNVDADTGYVQIVAYDDVFTFGATGYKGGGDPGDPADERGGLSITAAESTFNTFIHGSGMQIRDDQRPLSWWEADENDASLVNFFSPRAVFRDRTQLGDYEMLREAKSTGSRLVIRYKGA